jgi:hypothetical protein
MDTYKRTTEKDIIITKTPDPYQVKVNLDALADEKLAILEQIDALNAQKAAEIRPRLERIAEIDDLIAKVTVLPIDPIAPVDP